MQMKSLLALSVLVSAVFLTGISNAQTDPATAEQAAENQPAVVEASDVQAEPKAKAKKASKKRHKHKHKRKRHHHGLFHGHVHPVQPLEQRLAPHWVWSHHRAPCNNVYVGGTLSYGVRGINLDSDFSFLLPPVLGIPASTGAYEYGYTDNGVLFGLLGGWQWRINRFMIGAEANIDFQNFEKTEAFALSFVTPLGLGAYRGSVLYDRGDTYGLSARFGYFVTPFFFPYIKAGAQFSRDEVTFQSFSSVTIPIPGVGFTSFPDFVSEKKDVWGWVLGVGMEFPTYIGASTIRIEYNMIETESFTIGDTIGPVVGRLHFDHPIQHTGRISWVWNFL